MIKKYESFVNEGEEYEMSSGEELAFQLGIRNFKIETVQEENNDIIIRGYKDGELCEMKLENTQLSQISFENISDIL